LWPEGVDAGDPRNAEVPLQVRIEEGGDHAARGAVDVDRDVQASLFLEAVERVGDLRHRLVAAVEGGAQDRHHADRVLVDELDRLLAGEVETVARHRDQPRFDLEVVCEFLPADLDVDAHDDVGLVGRLAGRAALLLPAALHRQAAEHARLR
jgi:hypothetical protein